VIATLPSSLIAAIPVAIAAGLVSFASPCILPLVPGYMAFIGGAIGGPDARRRKSRAVTGAVVFIGGFSTVFVVEGALFGELGSTLKTHQRPIEIAFGVLTIILGLFFAGWLPNRWMQREARWHRLPSATILGAGALGFLFGLGWSPCIGPTLASILGIAASSSNATALRGSILALFYCLGLGIPFLLFALAGEWAAKTSRWLRRHQRAVAIVGGVMLIAIGVAELMGWWQDLVVWLQVHVPSPSLPL
jgi:cytochrome c-type biogenesis protein